MSSNANASVNAGWGLPILALGLVLRFATSPTNTWAGIHTQTAGTILLVLSGIFFLFTLIMMAVILIVLAAAGSRVNGSKTLKRRF